jgi:hypothetical protein
MFALALLQTELGPRSLYQRFPDSAITQSKASSSFTAKRRLWTALEEPGSSPFARVLALCLLLCVVASTASFVCGAEPVCAAPRQGLLSAVEGFCALVFTLEYIARLVCCPPELRRRYVTSFYALVDLASIVPFYVELLAAQKGGGGGGTGLLRVVRLVRLLRLLKIGRYVLWMQIFGATLKISARPLGMLFFVTALSVLVNASAVYYVERGEWDPVSRKWVVPAGGGVVSMSAGSDTFFQSIPDTFWWTAVSIATVGYGDTYAITGLGRFLSALTFLQGIVLLAIPVSIITSTLHGEYDRITRIRDIRAVVEGAGNGVDAGAKDAALKSAGASPAGGLQVSAAAASGAGKSSRDDFVSGTAPNTARKIAAAAKSSKAESGLLNALRDDDNEEVDAEVEGSESIASAVLAARNAIMRRIQSSSATAPTLDINSKFTSELDQLSPVQAPTEPVSGDNRHGRRQSDAGLRPAPAQTGSGEQSPPADTVLTDIARAGRQIRGFGVDLLRDPWGVKHAQDVLEPESRAAKGSDRRDGGSGSGGGDPTWSAHYLRCVLETIRNQRRGLMSSLKTVELTNREAIGQEVRQFVADMRDPDRANALLNYARKAGLA